ncbi:hypothetical protein M514_20976 [Trichuris suis]|uniref:DDE-1 domain-containing protein n=1 Tax=Trichuris suis TaxID=68888 RepID=A0A085NBI6_9BILA|nr:hypothetical protein M514_20976 [Trichuris suis]
MPRIQPGYSISKERFTLLLGGNAEGDFKLKPMLVYKSLMPRALKGYREKSLPVIWRADTKALVTKAPVEDWFLKYLCPAVERYCEQSNLAFKALLILDNAPSHLITLGQLNENVQFWKKYNIRDAIDNVYQAWQKVSGSNMRSAWKLLFPDQEDSCRHECAQVEGITEEITKVGLSKLSLENLNAEVVKEVLESKLEELTNEDLLNCDVENAGTGELLSAAEALKEKAVNADLDIGCSMQFGREVDSAVLVHKRIYEAEAKSSSTQTTLFSFFRKTESVNSNT